MLSGILNTLREEQSPTEFGLSILAVWCFQKLQLF